MVGPSLFDGTAQAPWLGMAVARRSLDGSRAGREFTLSYTGIAARTMRAWCAHRSRRG